ncbi:transglutaminase domain-containing protein [Mucilaginibacter sp. KACC 22063]|uniref:transglutaminase domain-containing protein n=1 Tax=Mucilaginibacter sp. KACC 22063 TaxID=3025666 RepID=UPI0023663D14|nr:transglutaminase domain-containing protein [Mucilaginibacter sp. KACC 22063]WDF53716.1 DUF3857 domain-containing protein [Mucilaginibacter sp. KACC 22063]
MEKILFSYRLLPLSMFKYIFSLITFITVSYSSVLAQDFDWGTHTNEELDMKRYQKDTTAHALVLNEFGKVYFTTGTDRVLLITERHVKIKIFDDKAFESSGNVAIPLYKTDNSTLEIARDIKGITTYADENGIVHTAELDPKKVFYINESKHFEGVKFDMPNLRKGCIIEYKYTVESPYIHNIPRWEFQDDIPKLNSEIYLSIPAIYNYHISLHGPFKLTKNKSDLTRDCFSAGGTKCDCSELTFGMADIPAFVEEEYMTARKNFISAINFELTDYMNLSTGVKVKVAQEWRDIDNSLKTNEYFGSQIKRSGLMKDRIKGVIAGQTTDIAKAKAIYAFIQKNIRWDNNYGKYSADGIRKALDDHKGSIGDINLALIAALKAADINTEAVILATRNYGLVNRLYPTADDFNYVIAKVNIDGKSYMLDASDPYLGFGMLPLHCINDQGRVISFEKPSYWIDITPPFKKSELLSFELTLQPDGKLKGIYQLISTGYEAYLQRKAIKKFNSVDEYIENRDERWSKIKVLKADISGLDSLDKPLVENYTVEINAFKNTAGEKLMLNPNILGRQITNPFKLVDRTYPVDMGMPSERRIMVTLHVPHGYKFEHMPKDTAFALPNGGGKLIISAAQNQDDDVCNYSQMLQFNKPVYTVAEYPYIKELYNKLIQVDAGDIVLKKGL